MAIQRRTTRPGFDKGQIYNGSRLNIPGRFEMVAVGTAPARTIVRTGLQESDIEYILPASLADGVLCNAGGRLYWGGDGGAITKSGTCRRLTKIIEGFDELFGEVTFDVPFPDVNYSVLLTPVNPRDQHKAVPYGARITEKTPGGFTFIAFHDQGCDTSMVSVDWLAREVTDGLEGGATSSDDSDDESSSEVSSDDGPQIVLPEGWGQNWPLCAPPSELCVDVSGAGWGNVNGRYFVISLILNGMRAFQESIYGRLIFFNGALWELKAIDGTGDEFYRSLTPDLLTTGWEALQPEYEPAPTLAMSCQIPS